MAIKRRIPTPNSVQPLSEKERSFVASVDSGSAPSMPWEEYDPNDKFTPRDPAKGREQKGTAINVKFSQYEYEMLKYVAKKQNRSLHGQIKHMVMSNLQDVLKDLQ